MRVSLTVPAVAAAAFAASAEAKTFKYGQYTCEDERQAVTSANEPQPLKRTFVIVIGNDNVGQCLAKCDADPQCHTANIRHVPRPPKDDTICTIYRDKTVRKFAYPTIEGKQWGAVCSKP